MRKTHVEKKHQGGRIALYVISMILLLGVFSGLLYLRWEKPPEMIIAEADGPETVEKSAPAEPEETAAPEPTPMPTPEPTPEPMPDGTPFSVTNASALQRADGVYTMLFVGVDQISESTDTMILCRFDTKNHKVNCVSLPRDTLINIAWDVRKLNSVYSASLHNGGTGIDSLLTHVKWLTGIDVDCYAVVDLMTFQYVINELGGVWFDVPIARISTLTFTPDTSFWTVFTVCACAVSVRTMKTAISGALRCSRPFLRRLPSSSSRWATFPTWAMSSSCCRTACRPT